MKGINTRSFHTLFVLVVLILAAPSLRAQNYKYINHDRSRTYALNTSSYFFVGIDSVSVEGADTTYYFERLVDTTATGDCDITTGGSYILGPKVIFKSSDTTIFFNKNADSIILRTHPSAGVPWTAYRYPDGSYITATYMTLIYAYLMPGVQDSMKTIKFNVYDTLGTLLGDSALTGLNIDLTQNFGLAEFIDFNNFPYDTTNYKLRGLSNPDTQTVDINTFRAFDFQPGYEFHYREEIAPDDGSAADKRISAWKYFVMDKTQSAESVTYTMERIRFDTLYTGVVPSASIIWDTLEVTYNYNDYNFLDTLELNLLQGDHYGFSDWVRNDSIYKGIAHKYVYDWFDYNAADQCLSNPLYQPEQLYGDGLGLMHYKDSATADNYYKFDMVYFQQGLLVWGTPYDFSVLDVAVANIPELPGINIYPNPADNVVYVNNISTSSQLAYKIFNLQGGIEKEGWISSGTGEIELTDMQSGLYLITITSAAGQATYRLMKL